MKPLISCLCITKNQEALLARAIDCFEAQTYANKELLVMYDSNNDQVLPLKLAKDGVNGIRFLEIDAAQKLNLGQLRNLSIATCTGEYFCQWDDDDWYSSERLQLQMDTIEKEGTVACFLGRWLMYDITTGNAFVSHLRNWEGSILCKKAVVNEGLNYANVEKMEDTPFMEALEKQYAVSQLASPQVYIYLYHGNNTWNYEHFERNFKLSSQMSAAYSQTVGEIIQGKFSVAHATQLLNRHEMMDELNMKMAADLEHRKLIKDTAAQNER